MEIEFGSFAESLPFQEKFGELFALERGAIGIKERGAKGLDSAALDQMQAEIQERLQAKRDEYKVLAKKFNIKVVAGANKEIQRIMKLDSVALDELQAEIRGKLQIKQKAFKRMSHRLHQMSTTPKYIR